MSGEATIVADPQTWAEVEAVYGPSSRMDPRATPAAGRAAYDLVARAAEDGTPDAVRFEAWTRCAGWLADSPPALGSETTSTNTVGGGEGGRTAATSIARTWRPGRSALSASGAAAILAPWRVPRAV